MNIPPISRKRLRRPLQRLLRLALRLRSSSLRLDPGPLLVIAPHPDDDAFGCGGLILLERRAGRPIHLVVLTDGSGSHSGHPLITPAQLSALRRHEACLSAARLGLGSEGIEFFDLPDGQLPRLPPALRDSAVACLAGLINRLRPAAVLTPTRRDGSAEHLAAHSLVTAALARVISPPRLLGYQVWSAHHIRTFARLLLARARFHRVSFPGLAPAKLDAFGAHATQLAPTPPWTHPVLPPGFAASFSTEIEFFLDESPS